MKHQTEIVFDPEKHEYWLGKKKLVSVNRVLEYVGVKKKYDGDPIYGEIGKAAAKAIELDLKGDLDESSLDELIVPRLTAWRKFVADTGYKSVACEKIVHDDEFAGTLDHLGFIKDELWLIDTKCVQQVDHYGTKCQIAGYAVLLDACYPSKFGALQLDRDGNYTIHEYKYRPIEVWDSVMTLYRTKKERV